MWVLAAPPDAYVSELTVSASPASRCPAASADAGCLPVLAAPPDAYVSELTVSASPASR